MTSSRSPLIIFGLGNSRKYNGTRHNVGCEYLDYLVDFYGLQYKKQKKLYVANSIIKERSVVFLKSDHGMNMSGVALNTALPIIFAGSRYSKTEVQQNLLVLYDDVDLPMGTQRLKLQGRHAGHNGLKNIMQILKSSDVPRIKIGVGNNENEDISSFVLKKLSAIEKENLNQGKDIVRLKIEDYIQKQN